MGMSGLLEQYLITKDVSIKEAMMQINRNSKGIVYVVEVGKLIGALTDGDIRRYILEGGELEENVLNIANVNPKYLYLEDEKKVSEVLKENKLHSLPILNKDNIIQKIYFDNEKVELEKEKLNVPVVIMAGGKGTRLYPYTQILPKPLIPIGDMTITEHIMERFEKYGCEQFTMIVNYKKHFIRSYFDDTNIKRNVSFIEETKFLGTGGGLKLLEGQIDSTFFMTNCDILIEEDYSKIMKYHKESKNLITMVCADKRMVIPYGTVDINEKNEVLSLKEKPELSFITNTGLYVLEPEFLNIIPDNTFVHITDIIRECIGVGKNVGVYTISEDKWLDMGQLEELEKMKEKLKLN